MAATLKLGDRKWATKEGSLLAYNDENNNIKPLPFDFTRASSATRVNKQGLIETVASGVPRIDYTDANGALLLEPQRTNLITQSETFSDWLVLGSRTQITINDAISPDGTQNAAKLEQILVADDAAIRFTGLTIGVEYTFSLYAKKGNFDKMQLDISDGSAVLLTLTDDWVRYETTGTATANFVDISVRFGAVGSYFYIWGAQVEQGSYATSYIPTQGSAVTRIVDACSLTPISGIIGQTEGTMFLNADIQKFNDSSFYIGISNGLTLASAIYMLQPSSGTLQIQKRNAGVDTVLNITTGNWSAGFNKVAIVYTTTSLKVFINGVQKGSSSFSGLPPFTRFSLGSRPDQVGGLVPKTEYKQVKLYNTALTDSEAIALTT